MAATADTRTENHATDDRRRLAGWERSDWLDKWFDATTAMQRSYLEWVQATMQVLTPHAPIHRADRSIRQ